MKDPRAVSRRALPGTSEIESGRSNAEPYRSFRGASSGVSAVDAWSIGMESKQVKRLLLWVATTWSAGKNLARCRALALAPVRMPEGMTQ
jgi:hypothetical protein